MREAYDLLKQAKVFFLANVVGDEAKVRPMSSVILFEDKVYFETWEKKSMYRELLEYPKIQICGMVPEGWFRVTGEVVFDRRQEAKEAMLKAYPGLKELYSGGLQVFYLEEEKTDYYPAVAKRREML